MKAVLHAGIAIACLSTAGCGTRLAYMPLNSPPRAMQPRTPESVVMFTSSKPDRPYIEVGVIEAQQESQYSVDESEDVFLKMRRHAAERGCDGLILLGGNDRVEGQQTGHWGSTYTLTGYRATCIVYRDGAPSGS